MSYHIVTDSVIDLPSSLVDKWNLTIIPYVFTLDGKDYHNYIDHRELPIKDFYTALREGKIGSTTLVNSHRYVEVWEPILEEGKDIFYICLSSGISKSYDQSLMAIAEMKEKYPDRKIVSIDSKGGSLGQGLLTYYAVKGRDAGKNLDELTAYIEGLVNRLNHWIMPDDLNHLRRGGRVSGAAAFIGTMLNVKPVLTMIDDGRIVPVHKVRGTKKGLSYIIEQMVERGFDLKESIITIAHSDVPDLVNQAKELISEKFNNCEFIVNELGPIVGSHCGPGTIGIMFLGKDRYKLG